MGERMSMQRAWVMVCFLLAGVTACGAPESAEPAGAPVATPTLRDTEVGSVHAALKLSSPPTFESQFPETNPSGAFGKVVAMAGYTYTASIAAVGAYSENNGAFTDAGAVYLYSRHSQYGWASPVRFAGTATNQHFSQVAATAAGGTSRAAADGGGRLQVYIQSGGPWTAEYTDTGAMTGALAFAPSGTQLAVAGTSTQIRTRTGTTWPAAPSIAVPGKSVAWPEYIVVGNPEYVDLGTACPPNPPFHPTTGAVFVINPANGAFGTPILPPNATGEGPCSHHNMKFGNSVAGNGTWLAVGEFLKARVALYTGGPGYLFDSFLDLPPGLPINSAFGISVAMQGPWLVVGAINVDTNPGDFAGRAYVYRLRGTHWSFEHSLQASSPGTWSDYLGSSVAVHGNVALVGAEEVGDKGAAYEFFVDRGLPDFNGDEYPDIVIGAPVLPDSGIYSGVANVLLGNASGTPTAAGTIKEASFPAGAQDYDIFGVVSTWGRFDDDAYDDLAVGAPWRDPTGVAEAGSFFTYKGDGPSSTGLLPLQEYARGAPVEGTKGVSDIFGFGLATGDFNGDGYDDLAVGASGDTAFVGGSVQIFRGSSTGISTATDVVIQDPSPPGDPRAAGDSFGYALAAGDFNCDGKEDLAVGAPGRSVSGVSTAGRVYIFYGSTSGLVVPTSPTSFTDQNTSDTVETDDQFGLVLAAGNANADMVQTNGYQCADLAIGIPSEDEGALMDSGAVALLQGGSAGPIFYRRLIQGVGGAIDTPEAGDNFGAALAFLRANIGLYDDLAIGVPGENGSGAVHVLSGSVNGIGIPGVMWTQDTTNVPDTSETDDGWGAALAAGVDGTLLVGAPGENGSEGAVTLLRFGKTTNFTLDATPGAQVQYFQSSFPFPYNTNVAGAQFGFHISQRRLGP